MWGGVARFDGSGQRRRCAATPLSSHTRIESPAQNRVSPSEKRRVGFSEMPSRLFEEAESPSHNPESPSENGCLRVGFSEMPSRLFGSAESPFRGGESRVGVSARPLLPHRAWPLPNTNALGKPNRSKARIGHPRKSRGSGTKRPGYRPTRVPHATVPSSSGPSRKHTAKFEPDSWSWAQMTSGLGPPKRILSEEPCSPNL